MTSSPYLAACRAGRQKDLNNGSPFQEVRHALVSVAADLVGSRGAVLARSVLVFVGSDLRRLGAVRCWRRTSQGQHSQRPKAAGAAVQGSPMALQVSG